MEDAIKKQILDEFKAHGLMVAEELAVNATRAAFAVIKLLAPKISTIGGAIIVNAIDIIQPKILSMLDKINGKDNPNY